MLSTSPITSNPKNALMQYSYPFYPPYVSMKYCKVNCITAANDRAVNVNQNIFAPFYLPNILTV